MTGSKRIICLANSRKLAGRCIAGREWASGRGAGNWIRPISERENQEVSEYERQYKDGRDPRILDIIDIPLRKPQPKSYQTENWLLNVEYYWVKVGVFSSLDLPALTDPIEPLWVDGYSTYNGYNDKIPIGALGKTSSSLRLVRVVGVVLKVFAPGEAFGNSKRRVQGRFAHAGATYALWVTDPIYERRYLARSDGTYQIGECYLTISLGEPYQDSVFKLIAAIIEPDGQ